MTLDEIKELIQVVQQSGVAELEVQRGDNRVRIRRSSHTAPREFVIAPAAAPQQVMAGPAAAPAAQSGAGTNAPSPQAMPMAAATEAEADMELTAVKSPIVGTFYDAPSPGAPPFVKVGDRVTPGQVLCIIESMKLMNEIECEVAGTVMRKLVETGKPVEYGETLFAIRT